jgi:type I restriction enzyme S subunit
VNGWVARRLDELGQIERGRSRHRPRNDPRLYGSDVPFFQTGDVKAAVLHLSTPQQWYSERGVAQSRIWGPGVTCITIAANIAETAVLGVRACFPDSILGFTPSVQSADAYFVKYLLDTHRSRLTDAARGTTQDNLSVEKLLSFKFPMPEARERSTIVSVLRTFDELIENNRRRVGLLEEMARTIYREWFVHFRYPGHESIPLIDSPLGPIPEGWQATTLAEAAIITMGQSPASKFYNTEGIGKPFHQGVADFGMHFPITRKWCTVEGRSAFDGDVLISVRAPVGRINVADTDIVIGRGLAAVRARNGRQSALLGLLREVFAAEDSMGNDGAIFKSLGKTEFAAVPVVLPPEDLANAANEILADTQSMTRTLTHSSRRLVALRDLLLPKLVTGKIDVSGLDFDAVLEESAA